MTATTGKPPSIPATLRQLRKNRDLQLRHAAHAIGVAPSTMSRWEHGHAIPYIPELAAYARLLDQQLIVTRSGRHIADLAHILAHLPDLRKHHHLSAAALARSIHVEDSHVHAVEQRAQNGERLLLVTVQRHLAGLGYQIGLAGRERAA